MDGVGVRRRPAATAADQPPGAKSAVEAKRQRFNGRLPWSACGRCVPGLGKEEHGGAPRPFHFVQMADTQLGMEYQFARESREWSSELELMRRAVREVNRLRPAFAIVCGDLVDEFPAEERGRVGVDPRIREMQQEDFKEAMRRVDPDIPLLCLCGNHDVGDRPNSITVRSFTESYGDDYFTFWCNGVRCLVVNSQLWKDDTDAKDLRRAMDVWLAEELAATASQPPPTLVFSHVPPFLFDPDEKDEYFNLDRTVRHELLEKLAANGATGWFCGHYHRNAGGVFRDPQGRSLEVVVTGAVGVQITDKEGGDALGKSGIGGHKIGESVSGLRVVHVSDTGHFAHEWKTFKQLHDETVQAESVAD